MNLKELHDTVLNHPYRLEKDEKYKNAYQIALYRLSDAFDHAIKDREKYKDSNFMMIHDFNSAIFNVSIYMLHIERWLHIIHLFIDNDDIDHFYMDFTGCNTLQTLPKVRRYNYSNDKKKFIPQFSKEEVEDSIRRIEREWQKTPNLKFAQFGPYTEDWLDYLKEYKKEYYS